MACKVVFLLVAFAAGSLAALEKDAFFNHGDAQTRLVGGSVAPEGSAPHMVALTTGIILRSFLCGASVITSNRIVTAAHCVEGIFSFGSLSSSARGTVGTNRWNLGGFNYQFSRNITHPNYLANELKNDIALLVTTTNIVFSPTVSPISLAFDYVPGGVPTKVNGWGRIRLGGPISAELLELHTETIDGQICVQASAAAAILAGRTLPDVEPHIEVCTYHSINHGNCHGDSGSALVRVSDGALIGVVSWGLPCAAGAPDKFARVSAFENWLSESL